MKREIEALLFATDSPLTMARLKKLLSGAETTDIRKALEELEADYEESGNAFTVVEFGGGWQIATRPEFSPIVERMLKGRRFTRLSKAGLEVLAIIAYRQPLTRLEVDTIRGVNSSGAISTLTERNLVTVVGRSQTVGNPLLYGTTREFLNHLGLKGLGQLPDLPDLEGMVESPDKLKEFATQIGRDLSDEELEEYFAAPEEDRPDSEEDPEPGDGEDPVIDEPDGPGDIPVDEPDDPAEGPVETPEEPDPLGDPEDPDRDPVEDPRDPPEMVTDPDEERREHGE